MEDEIKKAYELIEQDKQERELRARQRIHEFILLVQEEEKVNVFITPINFQPELMIKSK